MNHLSPLLLLFGASAFVVLEYFCLKLGYILYPNIDVFSGYFWGVMGTGVIAFLYLVMNSSLREKTIEKVAEYWKWGIFLSAQVIAMGFVWFYAIRETPVGIVSFLDNMTIPISFILGFVFLKERISRIQIITLGLAGVGFFLFSSLSGEVSLNVFLALVVMSFLFSIQSFLVKKYISHYEFVPFVFIRNFITVGLLFAICMIGGLVDVIPFGAICIFTIGTLGGFFLGRILYFQAHKHVKLGAIHFFGLIEPISVMILSIIFLGEEISLQKIVASIVVLVGLFLFFRSEN